MRMIFPSVTITWLAFSISLRAQTISSRVSASLPRGPLSSIVSCSSSPFSSLLQHPRQSPCLPRHRYPPRLPFRNFRAPSIDRGYNHTDASAFCNHFGIRHHVMSCPYSLFKLQLSFSPFLDQLTENNVNEFPHGKCKDGFSKEDAIAECLEELLSNCCK